VTYGVGYVELLIFTVLPVVVIFVLLYLVIKWAVSSALRDISSTFRDTFTGSRCVREILDERYARSEIEREEYEQMRQDLQAELTTPNVRGPQRQR
jgi:uncharacterized membrane protein